MRRFLPGLSVIKLSTTILSTLFAVLASLFLVIGPLAQAQSGRAVLITQSVDESKLTILAGNTRPEAIKQNDRGLVADSLSMEHMMLQLKRSPEQERELLQYIEELQVPSSPNFHHWLTAKEYGERFGLATQDLGVITRWLESHGFKVNVVYENGTLIDFSGTAGQVQSAFHTEIHQLSVKGVKHFANMSDPRIPAALAPAVLGVVSLHDFKPHNNYKPRAKYTTSDSCQFGPCYLVVPGDLAKIYNLNPLFSASISGQGQTIVVVEDTNVFSTADWTTFRSVFGLSSFTGGSFTQVHPAPPSGTNNCANPGINSNDGEAILDAEYASAAAPSAAIELASCSDTATFGGLIAIQNLLNESSTPPAIISMSYGDCEAFNGATSNAAFNLTFQQAVTEGVSVFVSSGDQGAASCSINTGESSDTYGVGVSGWASTPYNVAVGGTDFGDTFAGTNSTYWNATNSSTYESALSYIPEIPWNDSCASVVIAQFLGFSQTFGSSGLCNAGIGGVTTASGSGGPSGCATGSPAIAGVVGGTCAGWAKPSWQSLVGNPSDGVRDIPDVSLFAANGVWDHFYPYCFTDSSNGGGPCTGTPDTWAGAGGTSFSSPIMAGIQALVNQKVGGRQGNPNPVYYSLAAAEYGASGDSSCNSTLGNTASSSCIFYDVTLGDMDVDCSGTHNCYLPSGTIGVLSTSDSSYLPAYGTTTGWDFATGIGTVNAYNLAVAYGNALLTPTTTTIQAAPTPVYAGLTVTLTATVSPSSATGQVSFFNNGSATALGTATLSGGIATLAVTTLPVGTDSISASYGGDSADGTSSTVTPAVVTVLAPTFTFTNTGSASHTVLAGQQTPAYTFLATPTSGSTFSGTVTFSCTFAPIDTTLTNSSCAFTPASVAGGGTAGATSVSMTVTTAGPNSGTGSQLRHRADNRSPWIPFTLPIAGMVMLGLAGRKLGKKASELSAISLLCFSLVVLGFMVACGGGGSSSPAPTVTVAPSSVKLFASETGNTWPSSATQQQFSATVNNTTSQTVTWAVTGGNANGTITSGGLYTAPATVPSPAAATVTATSSAAMTPGTGTANIQTPTGNGALPATYTVTVTANEAGTVKTQNVTLVVQ